MMEICDGHRWLVAQAEGGSVRLGDIPVVDYKELYDTFGLLLRLPQCHCVSYFAFPQDGALRFMALVADDRNARVYIASYFHDFTEVLPSLAAEFPAMHTFEREICENYGVEFTGSPNLKPLRFAHDRADKSSNILSYPFYTIDGDSLHEVNVGPIHAGLIEPGVFRFICNGEEVLHLEIVLGYQHRGVERLMRETGSRLRQSMIAEQIAGDNAAAHGTAFCMALERLGSDTERAVLQRSDVQAQRVLAIEMERIAMHIADTGALCSDIGYQLGQAACEALRTKIINATQHWCGNRFSKGLIRPWGSHYPMTEASADAIRCALADVMRRFRDVSRNMLNTPSVLGRFEDCGAVPRSQALAIGAVGISARASAVSRDIRSTHPCGVYRTLEHRMLTDDSCDVMARLKLRMEEISQSAGYVEELLKSMDVSAGAPKPCYDRSLASESLSFSLVEGWRGEICHVAVTDAASRIAHYKIKDPSQHNWMALALSVRGQGISDFPICNKSFNLSYCGHDL